MTEFCMAENVQVWYSPFILHLMQRQISKRWKDIEYQQIQNKRIFDNQQF